MASVVLRSATQSISKINMVLGYLVELSGHERAGHPMRAIIEQSVWAIHTTSNRFLHPKLDTRSSRPEYPLWCVGLPPLLPVQREVVNVGGDGG